MIEQTQRYGAAIAGVPAIDTIKRVERRAEGAVVEATIPREQIVQAQTPQGFRYGLLSPIFNEARIEGFQGTDEASLLERAGHTGSRRDGFGAQLSRSPLRQTWSWRNFSWRRSGASSQVSK